IFRNNGWQVGSSSPAKGEGFAVVNPPFNPNRSGCRAILINCLSEENNTGYGTISDAGNRIELINCTSRNNISAEYYAGLGKMVLRNCLGTNDDLSKITVTESGVMEVLDDSLVTA